MSNLTHFSLCSGIGGIDLAAEWAGFETVAQCEINEYASKLLAKNFTGVHNFGDIRTITTESIRNIGIEPGAVTALSAGFPCQPYSLAGLGKGDSDERDLWNEVVRCIGVVKPRWVVCENTPGLFSRENQRYFARVVNDLSALGFHLSWGIWGACDVGAPHQRDRVFIVGWNAYLSGNEAKFKIQGKQNPEFTGVCGEVSDTVIKRLEKTRTEQQTARIAGNDRKVSNTDSSGQQKCRFKRKSSIQFAQICSDISHTTSDKLGMFGREGEVKKVTSCGTNCRRGNERNVGGQWWQTEPDVGRVANGVSSRVDKLRCLGNAVVPQQVYPLWQAIADYELRESLRVN